MKRPNANRGQTLESQGIGRSPGVVSARLLVRRHGVRSIVGFGGSLSTGDLFAVVLFCRALVTAAVAQQFRALALHVKSALFAFGENDAFDPYPAAAGAREGTS